MTETYLTVVSHRAGNTESLQTDTDSLSGVSSILAAFLQRDGTTYHIRPLCVLKADTLRLLTSEIRVKTILFTYLVSLLDRSDTIGIQRGEDLFLAAVL